MFNLLTNLIVSTVQGVRDLFWLPIEQFQKDGRIVRGLQRGANAFSTSAALAVLELTSRMVQTLQVVTETSLNLPQYTWCELTITRLFIFQLKERGGNCV